MAEIRMDHLSKVYDGGVRAVDDISLTIADGEFFALLGPSGCGKTTLLRTIAGLEDATGGTIAIGERDVTKLDPGRRNVAMVFQDYALFPHMNVADNIAYPLKIKKMKVTERRTVAEQTAHSLSLDGLLERRPAQLSGGQQQRAALARAVASSPEVFLFDEPLSNLDARLRLEARTFLKQLQQDLAVTTVFVTHDQAEALALADTIAVMKNGTLQQVGSPREVFQTPANVFVASFIGSLPMNLLEATIKAGRVTFEGIDVDLPAEVGDMPAGEAPTDGSSVTYAMRPEYIGVSTTPGPGSFPGTVRVTENLGASLLVALDVGEQRVQVVVDEADEPTIGTTLHVTPNHERSLLFDADGVRIAATNKRLEDADAEAAVS